jgi:hypothetical protein
VIDRQGIIRYATSGEIAVQQLVDALTPVLVTSP